jgi:hypothetical protein
MMQQIIRATRSQHCSRGPVICGKCRAMNETKWMLLDIDPPDRGKVARPTIQIMLGTEPEWREYDVVRVFASEQEAKRYASDNQIPIQPA